MQLLFSIRALTRHLFQSSNKRIYFPSILLLCTVQSCGRPSAITFHFPSHFDLTNVSLRLFSVLCVRSFAPSTYCRARISNSNTEFQKFLTVLLSSCIYNPSFPPTPYNNMLRLNVFFDINSDSLAFLSSVTFVFFFSFYFSVVLTICCNRAF